MSHVEGLEIVTGVRFNQSNVKLPEPNLEETTYIDMPIEYDGVTQNFKVGVSTVLVELNRESENETHEEIINRLRLQRNEEDRKFP